MDFILKLEHKKPLKSPRRLQSIMISKLEGYGFKTKTISTILAKDQEEISKLPDTTRFPRTTNNRYKTYGFLILFETEPERYAENSFNDVITDFIKSREIEGFKVNVWKLGDELK